jgi:Flp pilus assembly protein TadG
MYYVRRKRFFSRRRGNTLVLCAVMMVMLFAMVAFAVDLGYVMTARSQLQTSADAAALAACWELIDENCHDPCWDGPDNARSTAGQFAGLNEVTGDAPALANDSNTSGDVLVGYLSDPHNPNATMVYNTPGDYNAVQVRVRRHGDQNGEVGLHFARLLGINSMRLEAQATAALLKNIGGFRLASGSEDTLDILPYALDLDTWEAFKNDDSGFSDSWTYNPATKTVSSGGDGVREINLFPQGTGCPGNRGTVDIGSSSNSTSDIARQIVHGVNASDLSYHGGKLELDDNGELSLNGDTGISAGVKDELASIKGKPRIIPIFSEVEGPGNNADYTIVAFVGVRIVDVKLTGSMSSKRVLIQPAKVITRGAIAASESGTSDYIYTPVHLVR